MQYLYQNNHFLSVYVPPNAVQDAIWNNYYLQVDKKQLITSNQHIQQLVPQYNSQIGLFIIQTSIFDKLQVYVNIISLTIMQINEAQNIIQFPNSPLLAFRQPRPNQSTLISLITPILYISNTRSKLISSRYTVAYASINRPLVDESGTGPFSRIQHDRIYARPRIYAQMDRTSLQLNHSSNKPNKQRKMQAHNIFFHPYYSSFDLQQYTSLFPYFDPTFNYGSSYQNYQMPDLQLVKIMPTAIDSSANPAVTVKEVVKTEQKSEKTKRPSSSPKSKKQKVQFISDNNVKYQKVQLIEQKEGRNANSNLLRMFFRRLHNKIEDRPHQIQQVINKYQLKISLQEFIEWIRINKVDHRNYIRIPSIRKFFVNQQFVHQHTKIMRILLKEFINNESIVCYLTSKKVRREVMVHNYHTIRNIVKEIFDVQCK